MSLVKRGSLFLEHEKEFSSVVKLTFSPKLCMNPSVFKSVVSFGGDVFGGALVYSTRAPWQLLVRLYDAP